MRMILLCFALLFFGCATNGKSVPPPSPIEAQVLSTAIMAVGLESKKNLDVEQLRKLTLILEDSRALLIAALDNDPATFPTVGNSIVAGVNPSYRALINAVVGVLVVRLQPAVDQGKTALAAEYVNAVLTGAQQAVQDRIAFEESNT